MRQPTLQFKAPTTIRSCLQNMGEPTVNKTPDSTNKTPRGPRVKSLRIPLGYLYSRAINEAGARKLDPNAFALGVLMDACGLRNPLLDGRVDLVMGDHIHPRSPLMVVYGPLVDAVRAAARRQGICATRFVAWRLGLALEEPYQRSVWDL